MQNYTSNPHNHHYQHMISALPYGLVTGWIAFFVLHSVLATTSFKHRFARHFPAIWPRYRLLYNLVSIITLLPVLAMTFALTTPVIWQWQGTAKSLMDGIALLAIVGFLVSMKYYDGLAFLGLRPDATRPMGSADEPLVISPLHRYVRHPWYFFALLIIWTRDMNAGWLVASVLMTAYFILGSRLEENKLINEYGQNYARYRRRVPGIIPLPGRSLSKTEAADIMKHG